MTNKRFVYVPHCPVCGSLNVEFYTVTVYARSNPKTDVAAGHLIPGKPGSEMYCRDCTAAVVAPTDATDLSNKFLLQEEYNVNERH